MSTSFREKNTRRCSKFSRHNSDAITMGKGRSSRKMEPDALREAQLHRGGTSLPHKTVSSQMKCEFGSESYILSERENNTRL